MLYLVQCAAPWLDQVGWQPELLQTLRPAEQLAALWVPSTITKTAATAKNRPEDRIDLVEANALDNDAGTWFRK